MCDGDNSVTESGRDATKGDSDEVSLGILML